MIADQAETVPVLRSSQFLLMKEVWSRFFETSVLETTLKMIRESPANAFHAVTTTTLASTLHYSGNISVNEQMLGGNFPLHSV